MQTSTCKSCQQPLRWVRMNTGGLSPVNAEPDPTGNIVIENGIGRVLTGDLFAAPADPETPRFKSHFASCTEAEKYRKRGRK